MPPDDIKRIYDGIDELNKSVKNLTESITGTTDGKTVGIRTILDQHQQTLDNHEERIEMLCEQQNKGLIKLAGIAGGAGAILGGVAGNADKLPDVVKMILGG